MVTKLSKRRVAPVLPHCLWLTPGIGTSARLPLDVEGIVLNSGTQRFAEKVIKATKGEKGIVEPTYVYLPGVSGGDAIAKETGVDYFSVPVELGVCWNV